MTDTTERDALTVNFMQHGGLDKQQARLIADIALQTRAALASSALPASATPLPVAGDVGKVHAALKSLIRGYVHLLEAGRDRLISLGYPCDSVETMERGDPWLKEARAALTPSKQEGAK